MGREGDRRLWEVEKMGLIKDGEAIDIVRSKINDDEVVCRNYRGVRGLDINNKGGGSMGKSAG